MIDSRLVLEMGQQRQRDLLADAEARRLIKQLNQGKRLHRHKLLGHLLRLPLTVGM